MPEESNKVFTEGKALTFWQKFTYAFGNVGTNLAPGLVVNWMIFFYIGRPLSEGSDERILLVGAGAMALINFMGRMVDSLADPLVGYFSDKWLHGSFLERPFCRYLRL